MKVIYNTCYADPWIKVAQKLKDEYGYEPVYWNGYEDDNSQNLVPQYFPDAIYHSYFDAWKGIFPKEINDRYKESYIDIDFIKEYAAYELQAIKMMDRMDPDRYSFNFMERQRHFRNMLKYWIACIEHLKPDLVISAVVPHRIFDYVLYLLCKRHHIKYVTFRGFSFPGRMIPLRDIFSIGNILDYSNSPLLSNKLDRQTLIESIDSDILDSYVKINSNDYSLARPDFVIKSEVLHKESNGLFPLFKKFLKDILGPIKGRNYGNSEIKKQIFPTYLKERTKSVGKSNMSIAKYSLLKLRANSYKVKLKNYYNSLVEYPDLNKPYVFYSLHYQPEATTSPSGDIFVDQMLCIEVLSKNIPSNYNIYIKEHPAQFHSHREGHTSRIKEFYEDLNNNPKVRLMPLDYDPFTLIKNSKAVATVTGTVGWEAMSLGKPVIIFGLAWYEKYYGVLKVVDELSASGIPRFINDFEFDEIKLLTYLSAFSKKSVKAYAYRGKKQNLKQSEDECIVNLSNSIIQMVNHD